MLPCLYSHAVQVHERVPSLDAAEDREGHSHTFCCYSPSSRAVAATTAAMIRKGLELQQRM